MDRHRWLSGVDLLYSRLGVAFCSRFQVDISDNCMYYFHSAIDKFFNLVKMAADHLQGNPIYSQVYRYNVSRGRTGTMGRNFFYFLQYEKGR